MPQLPDRKLRVVTEEDPQSQKDKEARRPDVVVIATTSARRNSFVRYVFEPMGVSVVTYPGGEEADIDDVVSIAKEKVRYARRILKDQGEIRPGNRVLYIASDVKTRPLIINGEQEIGTVSLGKPNRPEQVQVLFGQMALAARLGKSTPHYIIESGSAAHEEQGQKQITSPRLSSTTLVELDPHKVSRFADEDGFQTYLREFETYYRSPQYSNEGAHPAMTVMDLSAGLSIPVLVRMNAVTAINGVDRSDERFRGQLKNAVFQAGVGIQPQTLKASVPDIDAKIDEWPWLENVASKALREDE